MNMPKVAIVGRPNVGKSSLFNRLIQSRQTIIESTPGVTRDRIYAKTSWQGREFFLIDTGGLLSEENSDFHKLVTEQTQQAIAEADLIIFLVDGKQGLHSLDEDIAQILRKVQKKIIIAANKIDDYRKKDLVYDFCSLGLEIPMPVSAQHGLNIGDLLDEICKNLPQEKDLKEPQVLKEFIPVAIVGRPNVGKSSLFNVLLGQKRSIVHDIPGTTRDAIDTEIEIGYTSYLFIDTAGLKHKSKIKEDIEYYSSLRTQKAVRRSKIVLFVVDASDEITFQDKKIADLIVKEKKASIILCNKWDIMEKRLMTKASLKEYKDRFNEFLKSQLNFFSYSPVFFVSAIEKKGINFIFKGINQVNIEFHKEIEQIKLYRFMQEVVSLQPPPTYKRKTVKFYKAFQSGSEPPKIFFKVSNPDAVSPAYNRYLENKIRKAFGFTGTPVILKYVKV